MGLREPRHYQLRDGRTITIRSAEQADAVQIGQCIKKYIADNSGQVWAPDEVPGVVGNESSFIRECAENSNEILLVAEIQGKIVGNLDFHIGKRKRIAHVGEFGMSVLPNFKGNGIGSHLLEEMTIWAKENENIEKINLRVLSNNHPAIKLYKKFGFRQEGLKSREIKYEDGTYVDDIQMGLFV